MLIPFRRRRAPQVPPGLCDHLRRDIGAPPVPDPLRDLRRLGILLF